VWEYRDRQGWSDETALSVVMEFIEGEGVVEKFRAYLEQRAREEDEMYEED
jgi:hypothetical protein